MTDDDHTIEEIERIYKTLSPESQAKADAYAEKLLREQERKQARKEEPPRPMLSHLPVLLLGVGAFIRVVGLGASAIWFDEAVSYMRTGLPFLALYSDQSEYSGCLLLDVILRPIMALGNSLWLLRLPSLLASLGCLWMVWKLMDWFRITLPQRISVAALAAFTPGLLWMAQDARVYSLLSLLFLAAIYCALEGRHLGLLALCGLMPYAHSIGPFYALAVLAVAMAVYPWKIRALAWVVVLTALAWVPALVHALQVASAQPFWAGPLTVTTGLWSWLTAVWVGTLGSSWLFLFSLFLMFATLLLLISRSKARGRIVPALAFVLPIAGLLSASLIWGTNIFTYRVLMPAVWTFVLWLGWELGRRPGLNWRTALAVIWAILLLYNWNPAARGAYLDRAAAAIRSEWQTGDVLYYTTDTVRLPFEYYLGDLDGYISNVVDQPFLVLPGSERTSVPFAALTGELGYRRIWLITPDEGLLSRDERQQLDRLASGRTPLHTIRYLQAAPILVYLIEVSDAIP